MAFSFESFNKEFLFDFNSEGFEYLTAAESHEKYADEEEVNYQECDSKVTRVVAIGINKTDSPSAIYSENAWIATEEEFVNVPHHQLEIIRNLMNDPRAVAGIKAGKCGFYTEPYKNKYGLFYQVKFVNI